MEYIKRCIQLKSISAAVFILALFGIVFYSYTQIDLNLTLFSNSVYQNFQQQLISIGYFQRNLSASIFLTLYSIPIISYFCILIYIRKNSAYKKFLQPLVLGIAVAGILSYPAFSHDIFNYMFDARIVTKYFQNPYLHTALDFQGDLWTRFMHWTHRTYPYGPLWLILTVPVSFLGVGKFVLTLLLFKLFFASSYLFNTFLVGKIAGRIHREKRLFYIAAYSLNPLIITETVISPHNETFMLTLLLLSVFFLISRKGVILSSFFLLMSAGVKYVTAPLFVAFFLYRNFLKSDPNKLLVFGLLLLSLPLSFLVLSREFYPWYFVTAAGLGLLINDESIFFRLVLSVSSFLPLRYLEYILKGDYELVDPVFTELSYLVPALILFLIIVIILEKKRQTAKIHQGLVP